MNLEIYSYHDLLNTNNFKQLEKSLFNKGIVGIRDVPNFVEKCKNYIEVARNFAALPEPLKQQYAPNRDLGKIEGYELGTEKFKDSEGLWQIDNKKASFYAFVPENTQNVWPTEVDLQTPYLALGELILKTGKQLLSAIGLDNTIGLNHDLLVGHGRMLHYQKNTTHISNPNWCGAHYDHGLFTGLIPAYYFLDNQEIDEPDDAGLHILPTNAQDFIKINANDKSVLFFQVGEFAQLLTDDRIQATKHLVKNSITNIERFTFVLFFSADDNMIIKSNSELITDERYSHYQLPDGGISYKEWADASYSTYRAK